MNPERKALWLAWLRDPKNKQTQERLRQGRKFCCLGGACEVARHNGLKVKLTGDKVEGEAKVYNYDEEESELPRSVIEWFDLEDCNPSIIPDKEDRVALEKILGRPVYEVTLTALNDDAKYTFLQIADMIEKYL